MFKLHSKMALTLCAGAMLAICDVNEYRKCVKEFKIEAVEKLFDDKHIKLPSSDARFVDLKDDDSSIEVAKFAATFYIAFGSYYVLLAGSRRSARTVC